MRPGSWGRAMLAAGVTIGVLPIVGADPAYACSCVRTDEQQRYEQATHVFKGTVLAAQGAAMTEAGVSRDPVVYTFDVISTYKGRVTDPQQVSTAGDSAACGVDLDGDGPFLVFASRQPEGGTGAGSELTMNLCGGTRPIGEHDEPTFGRAPAPAPPEAPAEAPPEAPAQKPVDPEPAAPPAGEPETESGLSSTVIRNVGELLDDVGGLAGRNPPPGT